jgi:hypothetical protein
MEMNEKEKTTNLIQMDSKIVTHNSRNQHPKITPKEEKTEKEKENSKTKGENDFFP